MVGTVWEMKRGDGSSRIVALVTLSSSMSCIEFVGLCLLDECYPDDEGATDTNYTLDYLERQYKRIA